MLPRSLDVIVPVYRNADLVRACVDSLLAHWGEIAELQTRLTLINDSPDDDEVGRLLAAYAERDAGVRVVTNERNLGFVRTVNRGLAEAQRAGRDALIVNSDTVTFAGTLREIVRVARADPQIAFVSPRSNNASICSLPHFHGGTLPTPAESHARWATLSRTMPAFHFAPTAVGFYMFIAHVVLANHGGLNEEFGVGYEEENDLVMRAGKHGLRAVIANQAFAYHAGSASFSLTGLDLNDHKHQNLRKLADRHPEFLPLVRRYEAAAPYRAERLMGGLLPDAAGRVRVVIDLTGLGRHHNGTNEHALAVVRALAARWSDRLQLSGIGAAESFEFHGLDEVPALQRVEPGAPGLHAVALRIAQPFDMHHVNVLEGAAPINLFAMLDTIAEDCGPLAAQADLHPLWEHVARHANGLLFNSRFSEQTFCTRHPDARSLPRMTRLLATRLDAYRKALPPGTDSHVLVLGNHFPHKGSEPAARRLAAAYPTMKFVVLGADTWEQGNVTSFRSGTLAPAQMDGLFAGASIVVLPSHIEGFGLGFMHALAAGRPIVARRIPATEEILATLDDVRGVHLFDGDPDLVTAFAAALQSGPSAAGDRRGVSWDDWADGVGDLCLELTKAPDLFPRLVRRIEAGDLLRRSLRLEQLQPSGTRVAAPAAAPAPDVAPPPASPEAASAEALLRLDGRAFVEQAYATLLRRPADESGLAFYLAEIEAGVDKRDVLRALASSPEGRSRAVRLEGLDELLAAAAATSRSSRPWFRRLLRS